MTKNTIILLSIILLSACNGSSGRSYRGYSDGIYCAEVEYYYPKTGTTSTYTLEVEIEDNELTIIYWPNGGWLDDSHFTPPNISDGYAYFTSDRGVEYEVTILDEEDCSLDYYGQDEDELIEEARIAEAEETCPLCGDEKYSWEDYCDDCIDELEHTCSRCGAFQYNVNGGLCDDCENDDLN